MSFKELLREANGEEAYAELEAIRRSRRFSGDQPQLIQNLQKADGNGDGVVEPDDSLELHHGDLPQQRNPKDEK